MAATNLADGASMSTATPSSDPPAFALPGAILVLDPALKSADRRAVIESVLLAVLAANKSGGDVGAWLRTATQTLSNIGWVSQASSFARYHAPSQTLTFGRAATTAAEQLADGPDPELAAAAVDRAASNAEATEVVRSGGVHADANTVGLALAYKREGTPALQLILVASRQHSGTERAQQIELRAAVRSTDLEVSAADLTLQPDVYRSVASAVHDKIKDALARSLMPLAGR